MKDKIQQIVDALTLVDKQRSRERLSADQERLDRVLESSHAQMDQLRDSKQLYRTLFESIDEGFCIVEVLLNDDGAVAGCRFVETNPAFEQQTGLEEATMRWMNEPDAGRDVQWLELIYRVARTGESARLEPPADAFFRWFSIYAFQLGPPENRHVGLLFNDRTESLEADKAQARLAAIVESSDDAIVSKDLNGFIRTWNESAERLFGYKAEEVVGRSITVLFPPDRIQEEETILARIRRGQRVEHFETIRRCKSGRLVNVSVTVSPMYDAGGEIIGASKIARDITEQKRSERLMREQTGLLEIIASGSPLDECLTTLCAAVSRLNPGVRAAIMLADREKTKFLRPIAPDLFPTFADGLAGAPIDDTHIGTCGEAIHNSTSVTCRDIASDENWSEPWRTLCIDHGVRACHSTPILNANDEALGSFLLCFSETRGPDGWERRLADFGTRIASIALERDRSHQALVQSNQRLEETNDALEYLNETLESRVRKRTEQARRLASKLTMAEQEERRRVSQILHDDLQQLLYGIQFKMTFIRREAQKGPLLKYATEAFEWLSNAIQTTRQLTVDLSPPVLEGDGLADALEWLQTQMVDLHDLDVELQAERAFLIPNEDMRVLLFQAVRELLFNVVKHADTNQARVELREAEEPGRVIIEITDEGRGFDPAATERTAPTGFGLYSVRERLGLVGGRMHITSAPGEGTRIIIDAPVHPKDT